ncbi:MAG: hypothetical protein B7Y35_06985 [Sphingomonadales bacterium 28-64-96]|nr:MAG: hypothetical protein B7Y35_06985 [Sphingomonadales bacterium 28-64-96]
MKMLSGRARAGLLAATLAVVGIAGAGGAAFASGTANRHAEKPMAGMQDKAEAAKDAREAQMLAKTRISAGEAATIAARHTGMPVAEVELDDEATTPVWEVSVLGAGHEKTVMVDGLTGKVRSVSADDGESAEGGAAS